MAHYSELPRDQVETIASTLADILKSLGFDAMAADCRGDRLHRDLPRYAQTTVKMVRRYNPTKAPALVAILRKISLA